MSSLVNLFGAVTIMSIHFGSGHSCKCSPHLIVPEKLADCNDFVAYGTMLPSMIAIFSFGE